MNGCFQASILKSHVLRELRSSLLLRTGGSAAPVLLRESQWQKMVNSREEDEAREKQPLPRLSQYRQKPAKLEEGTREAGAVRGRFEAAKSSLKPPKAFEGANAISAGNEPSVPIEIVTVDTRGSAHA